MKTTDYWNAEWYLKSDIEKLNTQLACWNAQQVIQ